MSGRNKHGPGRKLSLSWQQAHWLKKRDVAGVTEREGDELKGREHKKSKGSLDTYSGRVREKAERNNESLTSHKDSHVCPNPPSFPSLPRCFSVAEPFMLSPSECLNSLLLFNSLDRSWGHDTDHHHATSKHPNTHTHIRTHNHHNSHTPRNKWGKLFVNANTHKRETVARKHSYHANFSYSMLTCDSPRCIHYNTCPPLVNLL